MKWLALAMEINVALEREGGREKVVTVSWHRKLHTLDYNSPNDTGEYYVVPNLRVFSLLLKHKQEIV